MIVVLNGPLGVGKTETAWMLLEYFDRAAILDADYVGGNIRPLDHDDPSTFSHIADALLVLAKHQSEQSGLQHFIISGVFLGKEMELLCSVLSALDLAIAPYLLLADEAVLSTRILMRNSKDVAYEIERARELWHMLIADSGRQSIGKPIDTSLLTLKETTDIIWKDIQPFINLQHGV